MKVTELRIGNWLKAPFGELLQVKQLGHKDNPDYIFAEGKEGFGQNGFEGIDLTPSLLKKITWPNRGYYDLEFDMGELYFCKLGNKVRCVRYLHELQNIHYECSGQELEIEFESEQ